MPAIRFVVSATLVLGLVCLVTCKDKADDEKKASSTNASAQTPQQPSPTADDDDDNPAEVNAAAPENSAPLQAAGRQLAYSFDSDTAGQSPQKFHSAITGSGSESKWVVMADPSAPSKPNVVAQTSTDQTDYRFPLLIAESPLANGTSCGLRQWATRSLATTTAARRLKPLTRRSRMLARSGFGQKLIP